VAVRHRAQAEGVTARIAAAALAGLALGSLPASGCGAGPPEPQPTVTGDVRPATPVTGGPPTYTVDLPSGWRTASPRQRAAVRFKFYRLYLGRTTGGFTTNVNVLAYQRRLGIDAIAFARASERESRRAFQATTVRPVQASYLGGQPAAVYDYVFRADGRRLQGRQVTVLHRDRAYQVTFTAVPRAFGREVGQFEKILETWRWRPKAPAGAAP
jgi:hypothetical protein